MGAWVMTLGLRAADGMDWRLQMNKPDPVIPMGQEISPGDISLADAKKARWTPAAMICATTHWSPSYVLGGSICHLSAMTRRGSWPGPLR